MPNFIHCLIQGHENTDQEAIKLYHKADKRARAKADANGQRVYAGDEVAEELGALLKAQLEAVDLKDKEIYDDLLQKNWNWNARVSRDDMGYCATVQQILNGMLPECRDHQHERRDPLAKECAELLAACEEYKGHLKNLKKRETEKIRLESRKKGMYHELNPQNKKTQKINDQIAAVKLLIDALKADDNSSEKLRNFQAIYHDNKKTIEAGHDTAADKFKKVISSILLILKGKAKEISSLWKSRGEVLLEKVPEPFKRVKNPYKKI